MLWIYRLPIFCILLCLALLASCGSNTGTNQNAPSASTPDHSSSATVKPSPTTNGTSVARMGPVTLYTDALNYRTSDMITVTLSNQSNQAIYFPDHLTNCTVILLQRPKVQPRAGDDVQGIVNPCRLAIATRIHSLGAGQRLDVKLVATPGGWTPGIYHASLTYRTSPDTGPSTTISSAAFMVGPLLPPQP